MKNIGREAFDFEVLKAAYDSDVKIQNVVSNIDKNYVELKDPTETDITGNQRTPNKNTVSQMAKRAVDL